MNDKIKPGDLVTLDDEHFASGEVQSWGIGIFIGHSAYPESERCHSRVFWLNPKDKANQGFWGWNEFLRKLS